MNLPGPSVQLVLVQKPLAKSLYFGADFSIWDLLVFHGMGSALQSIDINSSRSGRLSPAWVRMGNWYPATMLVIPSTWPLLKLI